MFKSARMLLPAFNRRGRRRTFIIGATLLLTMTGLAIGAQTVLSWTLDRLLIADAQFTAADLATVLEPLPKEGRATDLTSSRVVGVTMMDASGTTMLTATNGQRTDAPLFEPVKNFTPSALLLTDRSGASIFADVSVPTPAGGGLSVRLDQTGKRAFYWDQLKEAASVFGCIAVIAFGFPATAYYSQWRQRRADQARIEYLARHDGMTGVLNRTAFLERLDDELARTRSGGHVAIHYIDLDRFKETNDTLGHDVGDELLRIVAQRLGAVVRSTDYVARFGGDEFAILQTGMNRAEDAAGLAERIVATIKEPLSIRGHDFRISASLGVATYPEHALSSAVLLKAADLALYNAKACGRDGYRLFNPDMDIELQARRKLEQQIRTAAECGQFDLHFQPIMGGRGEELKGFEALLRLPDGEGGFIPPTIFVPVSEEMGAISKIGAWVLKQACAKAALWPDNLMVAVNLSPAQFEDGTIVDDVRAALEESGLDAARLELEITEGLLLACDSPILHQLEALKRLGVSIAMDDFGTGYSSLAYLWKFPFNKIKIDRCFMEALDANDPNVASILKTIVSLGHSLEMKVTAEGIETRPQAALMNSLACDYVQGYLFGRPIAETEIAGVILRAAIQSGSAPRGRPATPDTAIQTAA